MLGEGLVAPPPDPSPPTDPGAADSWLTARPRTPWLVAAAIALAGAVGVLGAHDPRDALALVVGVAVVLVVLLRPFVGGLLLVGLVPIISGLAPGIPVPSVRASEALIGVVGLTLIVSVRRRHAVPWGPVDWALLAYGLAWAALGAVDAVSLHQQLTLGDWGTVIGQLQFFLVYRGVRLSVRTPRQRRIALGAVLVASVPVAVLAVLQELHAPGIGALLAHITGSGNTSTATAGTGTTTTVSSTFDRASGPFENWTSLAGYCFPLLLVLCAVTLGGQMGRRRRWFLAIAALGTVALLVSEEQSAIIGLLIGVVALGLLYHQTRRVLRWLVVGVLAAAVLVGPLLGTRIAQETTKGAGTASSTGIVPQTLVFRDQVWTGQYLPAVAQRPLTGYGVVLPSSIRWSATESEYVTVLMDGGLPLLALFVLLTWAMLRCCRQRARSPDPFDQALGRALLVALVALVFMDVVWPYMSNGGLPQVLFALLAISEPAGASVLPTHPAPAPGSEVALAGARG